MGLQYQNGVLRLTNPAGQETFNTGFGMMLCFGLYSGTAAYPRTNSGSNWAYQVTDVTIAAGINPLATFVSGMCRAARPEYGLYSSWLSIGGGCMLIGNPPGGVAGAFNMVATPFIDRTNPSSPNLMIRMERRYGARMEIPSAEIQYKLALLGFANAG